MHTHTNRVEKRVIRRIKHNTAGTNRGKNSIIRGIEHNTHVQREGREIDEG